MGEAANQPKVELFPETDTKFFVRVVDARVTFVKDEKARVTGLILRQGGRDLPASKIK